MTGLELVSSLAAGNPMPMASHFSFRIKSVARGDVVALATPSAEHYNPFGVAQGGFAGTVLDMTLGLVSISVLEEGASVATTDLSVRYMRAIRAETGTLTAKGTILHAGRRVVIAEARLSDDAGKLYAVAHSTSIIASSN